MVSLKIYEPIPLAECDTSDSEKRSSRTIITHVINPRVLETMKQIPDIFIRKTARRIRIKPVIITLSVIILVSLYLGGILTYLFEEDFTNYTYPLEIDNVTGLITDIDTFLVRQQSQDLLLGIKPVHRESIVEAIENIQAKDSQGNKLVPLTQFDGLDFTLDINPTCLQQWGTSQMKSTLLAASSQQQHLITVIIVVKSAVNNYARRQAVRESWYLNRTLDLFMFKTVFVVGKCHERNFIPPPSIQLNSSSKWSTEDCNINIQSEAERHGDIVQSSGIDSYYNNTIKTYMTLRWLNQRCPADFTIAIDDDYVFEVNNFINHMYELANLVPPSSFGYKHLDLSKYVISDSIPDSSKLAAAMPASSLTGQDGFVLQKTVSKSDSMNSQGQPSMKTPPEDTIRRGTLNILNKQSGLTALDTAINSDELNTRLHALRQLSKNHLWAGYVRSFNHPLRSVLSKWYISRDEYAYNKYPPFVTGGWVLMSFKTIKYLYYTTYFTRSFKFDDVYLGMLAYKLGLNATHSENFMCSVDAYLNANPIRPNSTNCIGVHDIHPTQLIELWKIRRGE